MNKYDFEIYQKKGKANSSKVTHFLNKTELKGQFN
jgi:hypothetical protein